MKLSKNLTIFEGPDGSGKTTAALAYAKSTGAYYVHLGPFTGVTDIGRFYVEAMMPAVLGHCDVVMDRCWLSEMPYGHAFRGGADRLGVVGRRHLERLALRCATKVVMCLPPWDVVASNFVSRRRPEMLDSLKQLRQVYEAYQNPANVNDQSFPVQLHDYTADKPVTDLELSWSRSAAHTMAGISAGNLLARVALIGEAFGKHKATDPLYQWPFGSFSRSGCSHWLTTELNAAGVNENQLFWLNADQLQPPVGKYLKAVPLVIALGIEAELALGALSVPYTGVKHPAYWQRFHDNQTYPLIDLIKKELNNA